jgi:cysteinyl-tRNA synthetase
MLRLFNTFGKKLESFRPVRREGVAVFTCGPSVYQKAHIGNFRTFLFEDILVRYLIFSGYPVQRGMNLTDIEDKSIQEAEKQKTTVKRLTEKNIRAFITEMKALEMKIPDYLPKASECVNEAVDIIEHLLSIKTAYWYNGNVYFDPLKFPGFGKLYGLNMSRWPSRKKRFHKDTYPGTQWNLGDFILWHGYRTGDAHFWDTRIGRGRPSWNVQDPSMISGHFHETLSIYCGGIDNLYRHHDYTLAILESVRPYPMARYWLHCEHLYMNGRKMSKSRGNIMYVDSLREHGYTLPEIRFFLIYGHYRERLHYADERMREAANTLKNLKRKVKAIERKTAGKAGIDGPLVQGLEKTFAGNMDNDLNVRDAFDGMCSVVSEIKLDDLKPAEAAGVLKTLRKIDEVFKVIF